MTQLVIPAPEAFGGRVTTRVPLARVVAVLRQYNPHAPFGQIKSVAESLRRGEAPAAPFVQAEIGEAPPSDAGTRVFVDESTKPRGENKTDTPAGGEVPGVTADGSDLATPPAERHKPTRAEVEAWRSRQPARARRDLPMSSRGRIPAATLKAYRDAHRDEYMASLVPVQGGAPIPAEPPESETY